jgi:hypothetical protein
LRIASNLSLDDAEKKICLQLFDILSCSENKVVEN